MQGVILLHRFTIAWTVIISLVWASTLWLTGSKRNSITEDALLLQRYISNATRIVAGDYSGMSEDSHEEYLKNFREIYNRVNNYFSSPLVDKPYYVYTTLARASDAITRMELTMRKNFIRKQPFGIIVSGPPGSGKTFGLQRLCTDLYNLDHKQCKVEDIVVLNEGDNFHSEFQTRHKIVIFDDLGATMAEFADGDPFRKIIDFINNVPKTALSAHLELKGIIWIQPDIVGATTNLPLPFKQTNKSIKNLSSVYCPEALNRRFVLKVWQMGYDEFYLVPDDYDGHPHSLSYHTSFTNPKHRLNYDQLFEKAKYLYTKHNLEQDAFIKLTKTLNCESASLQFSVLVAFQQALRLLVGNVALSWFFPSSFLVLFKRFISFPLADMKNTLKSKLLAELYRKGVSSSELTYVTGVLEKRCRGFISVCYLLGAKDVREIIQRVVVIAVPIMIKGSQPSWCYDILSICLPYGLSQIIGEANSFYNYLYNLNYNLWNKTNSYFTSCYSYIIFKLNLNQVPEGKRLDYLEKILDIKFIDACIESYFNSRGDVVQDFKSLEVFEDGIILHAIQTGSVCFPKRIMSPQQNMSGVVHGIKISMEEYIEIRNRYYNENPVLKPEAKKFHFFHKEMKYTTPKQKDMKRLDYHRYPKEGYQNVLTKLVNDEVTVARAVSDLGGCGSSSLNLLPKCNLAPDNTLIRGKLTLVYLRGSDTLYIIYPDRLTQKGYINVPENLINIFKGKCKLVLIIVKHKSKQRSVVPLFLPYFMLIEQDLMIMNQHTRVQEYLYEGWPRKGQLFQFTGFIRKSNDIPIRVESLEYRGVQKNKDELAHNKDSEESTCQGDENTEVKVTTSAFGKIKSRLVRDPMFGLTEMRLYEDYGEVPYDMNGNINQAMLARDL